MVTTNTVCGVRRECDQVAGDMQAAGIMARPYHAGLADKLRLEVQERWITEDRCKVG